jgi:hypothetical protein
MARNFASCQLFSISFNETTNITLSARLAIIAEYIDGAIMRKESVKLELCLSALLEKKFMSCKKYF